MKGEQIDIFECLFETYKIKKTIRLIEFFAGYGSQALALKYLGANFEHWRICEWAIPSIIAYADLHRDELPLYHTNFSKPLTKQEIANYLFDKGVSIDYNKPATFEQLKRMSEEKLRLVYNSIQCTHNLVDISRVHGKELAVEREREYLLTYSFPCQDLSLAGKGAGMEKGTGTRSGLLWEVERILTECENKPQILLMENVTQVHGKKNKEHFEKWQLRLKEMGYSNYWNDMTAVDFGIPQTRNRTFMISILGNYNYNFPKKVPLKLRLKDLLESNVDEKYYLSDKMLAGMQNTNFESYKLENKLLDRGGNASTIIARFEGSPQLIMDTPNLKIKNATKKGYLEATDGDGVDISSRMESHRGTVQKNKAQTITTMGGENVGVVVKENTPKYTEKSLEKIKKNIIKGDVSGSLTTTGMQSINHDGCQLVKIDLKRGYSCEVKEEQDDSTDVDVIGNYSKSNFNQTSIVGKNGVAPTVTENHGQVTAIVEKNNLKSKMCKELIENGKVKENDVVRHSYTNSRMSGEMKDIKQNNISPTLDTRCDCLGVVVKDKEDIKPKVIGGVGEMKSNGGTQFYQQDRVYDSNVSISLATGFNQNYQVGLRIRKLTPKECFRLMGLKDEDVTKIMEHQTNASGYHLAGDSIVTTCLCAIFSTLMDINWEEHFKPKEWWKNK